MCRTDNYILRITNTTLADGSLTISSDNSTVSFDTPDYLRKKGKCKITVVDGNICMVKSVNARLNLNNTKTIFLLQSNIPQLGYYTETRGAPTVLGTSPTIYTGATNDGYNVPFGGATPLIFTCPELPPVIEVQRMVYIGTTLKASDTTVVVPFFVELSIQFYEDMPEE